VHIVWSFIEVIVWPDREFFCDFCSVKAIFVLGFRRWTRHQLSSCKRRALSFLLFVSDCELEGLLLVCYVKQGGGWRWMAKRDLWMQERREDQDVGWG
jgi:hypothetical protein